MSKSGNLRYAAKNVAPRNASASQNVETSLVPFVGVGIGGGTGGSGGKVTLHQSQYRAWSEFIRLHRVQDFISVTISPSS